MQAVYTLPFYEFLFQNEEKILQFLDSKKPNKQLLIVDEAQISPDKLHSELLREKTKGRESSKSSASLSPPHVSTGLPTGHTNPLNPLNPNPVTHTLGPVSGNVTSGFSIGKSQGSPTDAIATKIIEATAKAISGKVVTQSSSTEQSKASIPVLQTIPTFFQSNKISQGDEIPVFAIERVLHRVGEITQSNIQNLLESLKLPFFMKNTLWTSLTQFVKSTNPQQNTILRLKSPQIMQYFNEYIKGKDKIDRYFNIIKQDHKRNYLIPSDFEILVKEIIDTHQGLTFLNEHESYKHFHTYYTKCVIVRIFYNISIGGADIIELREFRKSNFVQQLEFLKDTDNVNNELNYFSYEHFYVLFCKLWELDIEHSYMLTRDRLLQYSDYALTERIINRAFDGYGRKVKCPTIDRFGYEDFIWFVLCEEDKTTNQSLEYWFRCVDIDSDGIISAYEMEYFFKEQLERMTLVQQEVISFDDIFSQIIDMIKPKNPIGITLSDLKRSKMGHAFFNILFNLNKFLLFESKAATMTWNDWASIQYEQMAMEDG